MRRALPLFASLIIASGCPGHASRALEPGEPNAKAARVAPSYPATRWVPPRPTYLASARSVRGAVAAIAATIDAGGVLFGVGVGDAKSALRDLLRMDLFDFNTLSAMGIDLDGGLAVFSEGLNPTLVVHLTQPDQTLAYFDRLRDAGLPTTSVVIDKVELYTTKLGTGATISWAISDEWLWVHLAFTALKDDGTSWFGAKAGAPMWGAAWNAAARGASRVGTSKGLVGFADVPAVVQAIVGAASPKAADAIACAKLVAPIDRLGLAVEAGEGKVAGRFALGLGGSAAQVAHHLLPPPEGWSAASDKAAIGVQWNLDLSAVMAWLAPCTRTFGLGVGDRVAELGVRSARAFVEQLDLDNKSGRGAIAADVTSTALFDQYLSRIPMRSTLEHDETFGPYKGHEIAIPFGPTLDYVMTDHLAIAAVGDGLMMKLAGTGKPPAAPPIAAIDIVPSRIPASTWQTLLSLAGFRQPEKVVAQMNKWDDGHVALTILGDELVLEARGKRQTKSN